MSRFLISKDQRRELAIPNIKQVKEKISQERKKEMES